jgi:hypothetical protein
MSFASETGDACHHVSLFTDEREIHDLAVARHHGARCEFQQVVQRRGPVERERVRIHGRCALLDEVAGEADLVPVRENDDVVVGVSTAEVAKLDSTITQVDGGAHLQGVVRRHDHDLVQFVGERRLAL